MKKTLYSLILDEDVVREVDLLAHRLGTNRSSLINQILAEYVDYVTPERRISQVLSAVEQLLQPSRELVPFFAPNSSSMSMKSSLEYKYRPTIKYEVELYRDHLMPPHIVDLNDWQVPEWPTTPEGEERQAKDWLTLADTLFEHPLVEAMTGFFRLWKQIEDLHLAPITGRHEYALYEGKFLRSLALPERDCSTELLAGSISEYVKLFDRMLKAWLSGSMDAHQVEAAYYSYMKNAQLMV